MSTIASDAPARVSPPRVIRFRRALPEPLQVWHAAAVTEDGCVTSIARAWPEGVGCCGRCPVEKCNAEGGVCLLVVRRFVPEAEAADFGLARPAGDGAEVGPPVVLSIEPRAGE